MAEETKALSVGGAPSIGQPDLLDLPNSRRQSFSYNGSSNDLLSPGAPGPPMNSVASMTTSRRPGSSRVSGSLVGDPRRVPSMFPSSSGPSSNDPANCNHLFQLLREDIADLRLRLEHWMDRQGGAPERPSCMTRAVSRDEVVNVYCNGGPHREPWAGDVDLVSDSRQSLTASQTNTWLAGLGDEESGVASFTAQGFLAPAAGPRTPRGQSSAKPATVQWEREGSAPEHPGKEMERAQAWLRMTRGLLENPFQWSSSRDQLEDREATAELLPLWSLRAEHSKLGYAQAMVGKTELLKQAFRNSEKLPKNQADTLKGGNKWLRRLVMHPHKTPHYLWTLLGALFVCVDIVSVPMEVFIVNSRAQTYVLVSTLFWMCDVPVQFLTGYQVKGLLEMRPPETARRYLRSFFLLDCSMLAVDLLILLEQTQMFFHRVVRFARLVRLMRVLQLVRAQRLFRPFELGVQINSQTIMLLLIMLRYTSCIVLLNHYVACGWWGIGSLNEVSWITDKQLDSKSADLGTKYVASLHWSLTQLSPATNNITPMNTMERAYACGVIVFALLALSVFLSGVSQSVSQLQAMGIYINRELASIGEFFDSRSISRKLVARIQQYARDNLRKSKPRLHEQDIKFFAEMPQSIRIQLHSEMFMPILVASPMIGPFKDADSSLLRTISDTVMSEQAYAPQQDIFLPGVQATHIFHVVSGSLDYWSMTIRTLKGAVEPGQWVAEMAMWVHWVHRGHLVAETSSELVLLHCDSFHALLAASGGQLLAGLRVLAVFILGHMESEEEEGLPISDVSFQEEDVRFLAERAKQFWVMQGMPRSAQLMPNTMDPLGGLASAIPGARSVRRWQQRNRRSRSRPSVTTAKSGQSHLLSPVSSVRSVAAASVGSRKSRGGPVVATLSSGSAQSARLPSPRMASSEQSP